MAKEGKDTQDASTKRITQHVRVRAHARSGRGQLSLVEHALCPLDTAVSLKEGFIYEVEYLYTDEQRHMKKAKVRVGCLSGLSPNDEFYLWGLLALTFQQPEPSTELYATPHYLLKQLGCLDAGSDGAKGGENYRIFREALARLADVTYKNERFYDPIRGEHRDVSFGFLSYSLPIDPNSSRAWRLTWNTHFFEFCKAAGGYLFFDLETYRELDVASRRLFLTLKKVFHRSPTSPVYDVRHLAVNVLGFRAGLETWRYTDHLKRCAAKLVRHQIIELPESGVKGLFEKNGKGSYTSQFRRGRYFEKPEATKAPAPAAESAMYEPLRAIGFEDATIARIVATYRPELIQTWADITLAAKEKHGSDFFKRSPQAYFLDNLKKAAEGRRTPPDWWLEHRKEEDRRERESKRRVLGLPVSEQAANAEQDEEKAFEEYLKGEAREAMLAIVEQSVKEFQALGLPAGEIAGRAAEHARRQMQTRFRREHPEYEQASGPKPLGDILRAFVRPLKGPADDSPPTPTPPPRQTGESLTGGRLVPLKSILGPPRDYFPAAIHVVGAVSGHGRTTLTPSYRVEVEASSVVGPERTNGHNSGRSRILGLPETLDFFPFWLSPEGLLSDPTITELGAEGLCAEGGSCGWRSHAQATRKGDAFHLNEQRYGPVSAVAASR